MKAVFVTGIGTEVGKTVASAILAEAFEADYWKPIQCGDLEESDSHKIAYWISNPHTTVHPETFRLALPMSPHAAAEEEGLTVESSDFKVPATNRRLLVEGAGGLFVPLNDRECIIDLILFLNLPVVLVSKHYLGSINHTLLSIFALQKRGIPLLGVIFNGKENRSTESVIKKQSGVPILGRIDLLPKLDKEHIKSAAHSLAKSAKDIWNQ